MRLIPISSSQNIRTVLLAAIRPMRDFWVQIRLLSIAHNMKSPFGAHMVLPLAALLLSSLVMARSFRSTPMGLSHMTREKDSENPKEAGKEELSWGIYPTGSSLPDCSHACGPCFPCKRVMVSFQCSVAESCPIVYRCMCKGRFYHVPSN
ncbi:protein EPIDERMAL PATTERNING FACTOR 2-like protein [Cinnamomum micranthum f. kanehirae]|uniref:Epidermal patterning factor-like protein n=1 Tax=Cinnamomum micranthum f. kanehirae TaxID=337451 RepID=A0A443NZT6_9MAGN|nr:protein EPIDERMAL PATTERNING FACTOR 2-like protein [Cinnamomum micranthum f. kanehirae]